MLHSSLQPVQLAALSRFRGSFCTSRSALSCTLGSSRAMPNAGLDHRTCLLFVSHDTSLSLQWAVCPPGTLALPA